MGEGGKIQGVEKAEEGVGEVGRHNGRWVIGERVVGKRDVWGS